jgi:hypothetical protein
MDEAWALPSRRELMRLDRERRFGPLRTIRTSELLERRPRPPALKCLLVGVIVTLLYVWPLEFLANIFSGGFPRGVFYAVCAGSVVVVTAAAWILTAREMTYWEENWDTVSDFVTPAPWNPRKDRR